MVNGATLPNNMLSPVSAFQKNTQAAIGQMKEAGQTAEKAHETAQKAIEEKRAVVQEQRQQYQQFDKNNPFPKPDIKPFTEKPPENNPIKNFGSWASIIGIVAGAITQRGIATSLNASAAAMTAIRENDMKAYYDAKENWKLNTDAAIQQATWESQRIDHALKLMEKDMNAGLIEAELAFAEADNQAGLAAVKQGNIKALYEMQSQLAKVAMEGPAIEWNMMVAMNNSESLRAMTADFLEKNPQATEQQLALAQQGFMREIEQNAQALTPQQQVDAAKLKAAMNFATEANKTIPEGVSDVDRAKMEAANLKSAFDAVGIIGSGSGGSAWNNRKLQIINEADNMRNEARSTLTGPQLEEKLLEIDRWEQSEMQRGVATPLDGRGGVTLRNQMLAIDDVMPILDVMEAVINQDPRAVGLAAQGSAAVEAVLKQVAGNEEIDRKFLQDRAKLGTLLSQLDSMAMGSLNQVYGGSSQWSAQRAAMVKDILNVSSLLNYPDRALQSLNVLKSDLQMKKSTRSEAGVRKTTSRPDIGGAEPAAQSGRPTATDANGNKVEWDGTAWVPVK